MLYQDEQELLDSLSGIISLDSQDIAVQHGERLKQELIEPLLYNAVFHTDKKLRQLASWLIHEVALYVGVVPSSIQAFYKTRGSGNLLSKTVPAMHFRTLPYDFARAAFQAMQKTDCGALLFEFACDETEHSHQTAEEYAVAILAAAIKEGFNGPLFLHAGGLHVDAAAFKQSATQESSRLRNQITPLIETGYYNIEIDCSRLAASEQESLVERLRPTFEELAILTRHIRELQPKDVEVCIGGSISNLHESVNTLVELENFLHGYEAALKKQGSNLEGLTKIAVNVGNKRGGNILPDGRYGETVIDWKQLESLNDVAVRMHSLSGVVLHGLSTINDETMQALANAHILEAHLCTAYQDTMLTAAHLPESFLQEMNSYLEDAHRSAWQEGETREQFLQRTHHLAFGPFKKKFWDLSADIKHSITSALEKRMVSHMQNLGIAETKRLVRNQVRPIPIHWARPS